MVQFYLKYFLWITYGFYLFVALVFMAWERAKPLRPPDHRRWNRWFQNLGLMGINLFIIQLISSVTIVNFAYIAWKNNWGLFNKLGLPPWPSFFISLLVLDLGDFGAHFVFHRFSIGWKVHRVHHSDLEMDVTTAQRFHPFESLLSLGIRLGMIFLFGPFPAAVFLFDFLLWTTSFFIHANIRLSRFFEKTIGKILVTPDMHRVHHLTGYAESNSNFGVVFSFWDSSFWDLSIGRMGNRRDGNGAPGV